MLIGEPKEQSHEDESERCAKGSNVAEGRKVQTLKAAESHRREDHPRGKAGGDEANASRWLIAKAGNVLQRAADIGQRRTQTRDELFAGVRWSDAARGSRQQTHSNPFLQSKNR